MTCHLTGPTFRGVFVAVSNPCHSNSLFVLTFVVSRCELVEDIMDRCAFCVLASLHSTSPTPPPPLRKWRFEFGLCPDSTSRPKQQRRSHIEDPAPCRRFAWQERTPRSHRQHQLHLARARIGEAGGECSSSTAPSSSRRRVTFERRRQQPQRQANWRHRGNINYIGPTDSRILILSSAGSTEPPAAQRLAETSKAIPRGVR
jgi:hypothetical protein